MKIEGLNVIILLLIVLVLLTIFGIAFLIITSKTKERLALIEKGMDPNLSRSDVWVQIAVIGAGFSFGLIIADLLPGRFGSYGPLLGFVGAAAGLLAYNYLKGRNKRKSV